MDGSSPWFEAPERLATSGAPKESSSSSNLDAEARVRLTAPPRAASIDAVAPDPAAIVLCGDLAAMNLKTLLHAAAVDSLDGSLSIEPDAKIGLRQGQVVAARCGPLRGLEALRELFFRPRGAFVLALGEAPPPTVGLDRLHFAFVDAQRLRDGWARLRAAVLRPRLGLPWKPVGGVLDRFDVELDGRRPLEASVDLHECGVTLLVDVLLDALERGILEEVR